MHGIGVRPHISTSCVPPQDQLRQQALRQQQYLLQQQQQQEQQQQQAQTLYLHAQQQAASAAAAAAAQQVCCPRAHFTNDKPYCVVYASFGVLYFSKVFTGIARWRRPMMCEPAFNCRAKLLYTCVRNILVDPCVTSPDGGFKLDCTCAGFLSSCGQGVLSPQNIAALPGFEALRHIPVAASAYTKTVNIAHLALWSQALVVLPQICHFPCEHQFGSLGTTYSGMPERFIPRCIPSVIERLR